MSSKKSFISYIVALFLLAGLFSYSLVFAIPIKSQEYVFASESKNIFINSLDLRSNTIITNKHFSDFKVSGDCGVIGENLGEQGEYSVIKIKFLQESCKKKNIQVSFDLGGSIIKKTFKNINSFDLYEILLDKNTEVLKSSIEQLESSISEEKNLRKKQEYIYLKEFIQNIIDKRDKKYKVPVVGSNIPTLSSKVPNAARPYRKDYTDGIHHGWDFDSGRGDSVIALDDGIIIKVVDGFLFSDLGKLNKSAEITFEDRIHNLDILRGNQVWLKTMKGDVVFYSHLEEVFDDVQVGDVVTKGQPLGTVGISGVPDKNYTDYHLHLAVQKNPYINSKAGKYTELDYMKWDWSFKGKGVEYAQKHGKDLFEK